MPVWQGDATTVEGWLIEVPIRSPETPANVWIHWSGLAMDWPGFPPVLTNGDWHDALGMIAVPLEFGDKVVQGQGSLRICSAKREERFGFNTDDWGMALNAVEPLARPVEGPGFVQLPVSLSVLGYCWPVGVALTVDLLVFRISALPEVAPPYGERPKPKRHLSDRVKAVTDARRIIGLTEEIKQIAAGMVPARESSRPVPLEKNSVSSRRMSVELSMGFDSLRPRPPAPPKADDCEIKPGDG